MSSWFLAPKLFHVGIYTAVEISSGGSTGFNSHSLAATAYWTWNAQESYIVGRLGMLGM